MAISTLDQHLETDPSEWVGIAEVSARTGLTQDTLRWYEKQGLLPRVGRGTDGRRRYADPDVRLVELIVRLRRTGLPVAEMRAFAAMLDEGAASHGRRRSLLTDHRERVLDQVRQLHEDLAALDAKIDHYDRLIAAGLDCREEPIDDPETRRQQAEPS